MSLPLTIGHDAMPNVLNMRKRVTQISMNARAVVGVNEVSCLGMLGCGMLGQR